jgi:hypothetical protein
VEGETDSWDFGVGQYFALLVVCDEFEYELKSCRSLYGFSRRGLLSECHKPEIRQALQHVRPSLNGQDPNSRNLTLDASFLSHDIGTIGSRRSCLTY